MKKIELLSPAGNFECLKAAINNGADAVYLGGSSFSARAFAENFNNDSIVEAINYAHLRNVKIYVTINTLLNEFEIENAYKQAKFLYEHNVDALLVQDLGLFYRLRNDLKDFELHASTQMHIHNLAGVKVAKELGFKRVVLARESSLDLIKQCTKEDIEIECFVHGAICVSYSGQCLMSSATKNRSANKGMCSQCCRLKYTLTSNGKKIDTDTDYLLSPKDMCLLNDIPALIEAGVSSLKIEGRMKSPAYVGYVTACYRKAIDAYYNNEKFVITEEIINNLKLLYNRGFTNTYLLNDNSDLFSNNRPNHVGLKIGKVVNVKNDSVFIKLDAPINQFDGIRIISREDTGLILNMLKVNGLLVSSAKASDIIEIKTKDRVYIGDDVVKTHDQSLEESILKTKDKRIPLSLKIMVKTNSNIIVQASTSNIEYNYISNVIPQIAIKKPISKDNIIDTFLKADLHPYDIEIETIDLDNCFVSLKELNQLRRKFYIELDNYILNSFKREINKDLILGDLIDFAQNKTIYEQDFIINDVINTDSKYISNFVSEFGGLLLDGEKNGYYTLNVSNSYAFEFLLRLGFRNIVLSTELSNNEILYLCNEFKIRTLSNIKPYVLMKGRRALMYLNRNPFINFDDNLNFELYDGHNKYEIIIKNNHIELLENNELKNSRSDFYNYYIK